MSKRTLMVLMVLLTGAVAGGIGLYWMAFAPSTVAFEGERTVKIPRGVGLAAVVDSLEDQGILADGRSFALMARLTGWGDQVKAGNYAFESGLNNYDLLSTLRRGLQTPVRLTIPPGSRPEVVAEVVAKQMGFTPEAFLAALQDEALARDLGTDPDHLFAYMLPETYFFYWLTDPETVIRKVKQAFDDFYTPAMAAAAKNQKMTTDEVLRVAAIVEWETGHEDEKARVAGVYLNRLRDGWPLQADPTVQYAILEREGQKRRLLFRDYEIDHPYNTYNYRGLPPGPVTNPSPSSIRAVLNPEAHRYYFFVARGDGTHIFSRTLSEHTRNARSYYRLMRERRQAQQEGS